MMHDWLLPEIEVIWSQMRSWATWLLTVCPRASNSWEFLFLRADSRVCVKDIHPLPRSHHLSVIWPRKLRLGGHGKSVKKDRSWDRSVISLYSSWAFIELYIESKAAHRITFTEYHKNITSKITKIVALYKPILYRLYNSGYLITKLNRA